MPELPAFLDRKVQMARAEQMAEKHGGEPGKYIFAAVRELHREQFGGTPPPRTRTRDVPKI